MDPGWASSVTLAELRLSNDLASNNSLIPAPGSLFQSARNVEIQGGQFSTTRGHHTNLTINFNRQSFVRASERLFMYFYYLEMALDDDDELPPTVRGAAFKTYFNL